MDILIRQAAFYCDRLSPGFRKLLDNHELPGFATVIKMIIVFLHPRTL